MKAINNTLDVLKTIEKSVSPFLTLNFQKVFQINHEDLWLSKNLNTHLRYLQFLIGINNRIKNFAPSKIGSGIKYLS